MQFFHKQLGDNLFTNSTNICGIEEALSIASVYCPSIVEVEDCIFISQFYNGGLEVMKKQFGNDRKRIEMYVNSWSLADFFRMARNDLVDKDEVLEEFGKAMQYFWQVRFNNLFPGRNIKVILGENLMGEAGLTISVYQE
jgi:hypothetical protein